MEATILDILDKNKQVIEDSRSLKVSDKIVAHYYGLEDSNSQINFKDALIQLLYSFSTVKDFTSFSHLLYAALEIKPPNLDRVLYKFILNDKQLNKTFEGNNPSQICLKVLSQIPVNSVYLKNIKRFFEDKVDESIALHLLHFYAINNLNNESLSVLSKICKYRFYEEAQAPLSFQLLSSLKFIDPSIFKVWFKSKLEAKEIPDYILEAFRKTFERAEKIILRSGKKI